MVLTEAFFGVFVQLFSAAGLMTNGLPIMQLEDAVKVDPSCTVSWALCSSERERCSFAYSAYSAHLNDVVFVLRKKDFQL